MADYCKQCSEELFQEDFADLAGIASRGEHVSVICEGCGLTLVDYTGACVSSECLKKHGESLRPAQ